MYSYNIIKEEIIPGSLQDFRALMHEISHLQPPLNENSLFLQGERTPTEFPTGMGRWEVTLGGTLRKRGFVLARQLPNGATKLQFAYYNKFEPIVPQFEVEFTNHILGQINPIIQIDSKLLYYNLTHYFNKDELRAIAFEMNINYEEFSEKLSPFIIDFLKYCERHDRIKELQESCQKLRPNILWEE